MLFRFGDSGVFRSDTAWIAGKTVWLSLDMRVLLKNFGLVTISCMKVSPHPRCLASVLGSRPQDIGATIRTFKVSVAAPRRPPSPLQSFPQSLLCHCLWRFHPPGADRRPTFSLRRATATRPGCRPQPRPRFEKRRGVVRTLGPGFVPLQKIVIERAETYANAAGSFCYDAAQPQKKECRRLPRRSRDPEPQLPT